MGGGVRLLVCWTKVSHFKRPRKSMDIHALWLSASSIHSRMRLSISLLNHSSPVSLNKTRQIDRRRSLLGTCVGTRPSNSVAV